MYFANLQNTNDKYSMMREEFQEAADDLCQISSFKLAEKQFNEVQEVKKILCALLKTSDQYGLRRTTKYLARQYCMRMLKRCPSYMCMDTELLMISCLRLAVKFNENIEVSNSYTVDCCVSQSQNKYSPEHFVQFQLLLLQQLTYSLFIPSPYDYLAENGMILGFDETQQVLIQAAIDYTLSLVEFVGYSGEEIYGYCLAAIFEQRRIRNMRIFSHLQSLGKKIGNLKEKGMQICSTIFSMDQELEQDIY